MKVSFFYIFFFVLGLCILHCDISLISLPQPFLLLSVVSSLMTSVQCLPLCLFPMVFFPLFPTVFLTSPLSLILFSFIPFDFQVDNWKSNIPLLLCAVCLSSVCIFTLLQFSTSVFAFCIIGNHEHCVRLLLLILFSKLGTEIITPRKAAIRINDVFLRTNKCWLDSKDLRCHRCAYFSVELSKSRKHIELTHLTRGYR